jgi:hypothetical protein
MVMADLDALKRRLAALLNMTEANGCTAEEAAAATAKAAELMREHGLDEASLGMEMADAPYSEDDRLMNPLWRIIGHCTGCVCVVDPATGLRHYIGRDPGPTVAVYLHVFLARHVEAAVGRYGRSGEVRLKLKSLRPRLVEAFRQGMVERLMDAVLEHFGQPAPKLIEQAQAERNRRFCCTTPSASVPARRVEGQTIARQAGQKAGDGIALHRGLSGDRPRQIGGRPHG